MRTLMLILLLTALGTTALAEAPAVEWSRTFGNILNDRAMYVIETSDQCYVVAGYSYDTVAYSPANIWLAKFEPDGDTVWTRTIGDNVDNNLAYTVKETADGGLIVTGYSGGTFGTEGNNFILIRLTSAGTVVWTQDYDWDETADYAFDACQLLGGGYLVAGYTYYWSVPQGKNDWGFHLIRTDASGNVLHQYLDERAGIQDLNRVIPTSDSGALAIGRAGGIFLVKINNNGDTVWTRGYGGTGAGTSGMQLEEGGYVAFGHREFNPPNYDDFWLLRLNAQGDTLWSRQYQNPEDNMANDIDRTHEGGYIMCGDSYRNAVDWQDMYLVRTNANGDTLWTKLIGGDRSETAYSIKQTSDGGYIVVGSTNSYGEGEDDIYIVKLAPDPYSDAPDPSHNVPITFCLEQNYPNPFNPSTTVAYSLAARADVTIEVFNLLGQKVRTLLSESQAAGDHHIEWNGCDDTGAEVATGVYLYRVTAGDQTQCRKMLLVK